MNLVARIASLASRIGTEVKNKITATHPGVAKAWVCFGAVDSQMLIRRSFNVAGVTRLDKGRYRINFTLPMPDANYCFTATARSARDNGQQQFAIVRATADQKSTQFIDLVVASSTASFSDSTEINLVVFH